MDKFRFTTLKKKGENEENEYHTYARMEFKDKEKKYQEIMDLYKKFNESVLESKQNLIKITIALE